jgi:hypothetical protein
VGIGKKILKTSPIGYVAVKAYERHQGVEDTHEAIEEIPARDEVAVATDAVEASEADELATATGAVEETSAPDEVQDSEEEWDGDLHKRARKALNENLAAGEEVRVIMNMGRRSKSAAIIATDRRLFVFKTGAASGATFGCKFSSFDYRNVSGISMHTGAMSGSAVIDVAGAAPVGSSYWGNKNNDPWKAQNAIPLTRPYDEAKKQIASIRQLITDWHDRSVAPQGPAVQAETADVVDQIKRLGELRDSGLITPEEFEAKKSELLGRL